MFEVIFIGSPKDKNKKFHHKILIFEKVYITEQYKG